MSDYPHSADSESGFLGCIMASEGDILEEYPVTSEHFFISGNQIIAASCLELFATKTPVNALTVTPRLRDLGLIDQVGGAHGISSLFAPQSLAAHFHSVLCEKMALRRALDAATWATRTWGQAESTEWFLSEFQSRLSGIEIVQGERNEVPHAAEAIYSRLDKLARGESVTGIATGNRIWNDAFGGLVPGAYYALAGRPGTGKSAMMEEMIADMIAADIPVLVFQRDMSPQKMVERLCCRWCGIPYWRYVRGLLDLVEHGRIRETVRGLVDAPLYLYNPIGLTAEKLCAIMRREKRVHGIKAAFLDHIQALKVGKDLREGLTQASLAIRGCVTELDIPFVTLCHLNREGGKAERPSANNIKEFDQLFGDVDGMAILWSSSNQREQGSEGKRAVNFYVAKNRDGPESEEVIIFDGENLKFLGRATNP